MKPPLELPSLSIRKTQAASESAATNSVAIAIPFRGATLAEILSAPQFAPVFRNLLSARE
jgi:hypothetical protein